jgi:F420-non-reducing hydrogenase iron-sulfur subunit
MRVFAIAAMSAGGCPTAGDCEAAHSAAAVKLVIMSQQSSIVTAFVCANCARSGRGPASASQDRPEFPEFSWPGRARQVLVPCTGRLQPEHVLRAFEAGSSIVAVVACKEDNCHYLEGSRRCARRVEYLRSILKEVGLEDGRLLLFHLPGSAAEDLAQGSTLSPQHDATVEERISEIRRETMRAFRKYPPSPLQDNGTQKTGNAHE